MKIITTIILTLAMLCIIPTFAEDYTAEHWSAEAAQQYSEGNFAEAASSYDKAIELDPNNANLWNMRGIILAFQLDRTTEGIASFDKAVILNTSYHDAWFNRGMALAREERFDEALVSLDRATSLDPSYYDGWSN